MGSHRVNDDGFPWARGILVFLAGCAILVGIVYGLHVLVSLFI